MPRQSPTTSNQNKRHNKNNHNDQGLLNTKRPYDRSLSRTVDTKVERKSGYFTRNPEDDGHFEDLDAEYNYDAQIKGEEYQIQQAQATTLCDEELAFLLSTLTDSQAKEYQSNGGSPFQSLQHAEHQRQVLVAGMDSLFPKL